ncbi:MAG: hypothetical protein ACJZ83_11650 [Pseudohongiellaceae bacterium]
MTKKNTDRRTLTLERYLHCRLSMLSSRVSMRIAQTYGDKFAISVTEWRIMAVLGEYPGISADGSFQQNPNRETDPESRHQQAAQSKSAKPGERSCRQTALNAQTLQDRPIRLR